MEALGLLLVASPFLVAGWLRFRARLRAQARGAKRTTSRKTRVEREP